MGSWPDSPSAQRESGSETNGGPTYGGRVQVRVTSRDGSNIIAGQSLTVAQANGRLSDYVKAELSVVL